MDIQKTIANMTLEEKISYCTGADFWRTKAMPQHGIPAMKMADGPTGLRCQEDRPEMQGINESRPATCFPSAVTACSTWNTKLYGDEGGAIGLEALFNGVSMVLGPGCNIKRNPLCGRNFEYLSEDPYLSGKMAGSFVKTQQSTGAASCLKHFAVNNQEYKRQNGDSRLDERAFREIYLASFEYAVQDGKPQTVMCSYNKINGTHASDSKELLTDILREQWGFDGMVVTDWGAMHDRIAGMEAGCDLNMPGGSRYMEKELLEAVRSGRLDEAYIDACVARILKLVDSKQNLPSVTVDYDAHHELALEIARQGAVLLKNEDHILPLAPSDITLIGHMAKDMRYQGTGSSHINPTRLVQLTDVLPDVPFIACCDGNGEVTEQALAQAAELAKQKPIAVVVAGLPDLYEAESFDRDNMALPKGHDRMVEAVAAANPNTVVVLLGGSAMELPWADKVKAILYVGLPGQAGGQAMADLLTGAANPGGRLSESWPMSYEDVISKDTFGVRNPEYRESIYVGYRYYDKAGKAVRYPFGHGLSYTEFSYTDLQIDGRTVSVQITNTGAVAGSEVVQLYVAPPQNGLIRPQKELKGFDRIALQPGESRRVEFTLNDRAFAIWSDGWKVPAGTYGILVGASSRDIRLQDELAVDGETLPVPQWQQGSWYETLQGAPTREAWERCMGHAVPILPEPKKGSFTKDNTCMEMLDSSFVMKLQYRISENTVAKGFGGKKDLSDPAYRMMLTCAVDAPMRSVVINGGGKMTDSVAKGLLHMANGHFFKGLAAMLKK